MGVARVEVRGRLAIVTTSSGQKAVIPVDALCSFLERFGLEVEGEVVKCVKGTLNSSPP